MLVIQIPALTSNITTLPDPTTLNPINGDGWRISIYNSITSAANLTINTFAGAPLCSIKPSAMVAVAYLGGQWVVEKNEVNNVVKVAKAGGD